MIKILTFCTLIALASAQITFDKPFLVDSVSVKGKTLYTDVEATIDLEPTSLLVPEDILNEFNLALGFQKYYYGYIVDCVFIPKLPTIIFKIDGENYSLKDKEYLGSKGLSFGCVSTIKASPNGNWVFGRHFLRENLRILKN